MQSLPHWLPTKPTPLQLLDIAYIVVILPIFLILKTPMLFFVAIALFLIIKGDIPSTKRVLMLMLLGGVAVFLSLYGSFSFSGLSRLRLFVELLIYLLLIAVALQRLTRTINFYLKLSPALLMALSLFFFHSIGMLIYVILEVYLLLLVLMWAIMRTEIRAVLRVATLFYLISLPMMVLFFIFFPRISFEHATYGFKGEIVKHSGHDGVMHIDNEGLLVPSNRIVMEVGFEGAIPPMHQLYFRGSVLYIQKENTWIPLQIKPKSSVPQKYYADHTLTHYKVTLYPTNKKWLYLLDIPYETTTKAKTDYDLEFKVDKNIDEPILYKATSHTGESIETSLSTYLLHIALAFDPMRNPKSIVAIRKINASTDIPKERLVAISNLFRSQYLTYTLKPDAFDLKNATDSFLFDTKKGYCTHFASAFATLCRMAGIPSRIVTGYRPNGGDSIQNYLIVRQKDAHAWVEVYIDSAWQRVETTSLASVIQDGIETTNQTEQNAENQQNEWDKLSLYLHYIKYQVDTWILEYSVLSQKKLYSYFKSDTFFVLKFIGFFLLFVVLLFVAWWIFRRMQCRPKELCVLSPLFDLLAKKGYPKDPSESLNHYFERLCHEHQLPLETINLLYHQIRYQKIAQPNTLLQLKAEIKKATQHLLS